MRFISIITFLIFVFLIVGCTTSQFEISNKITPTISIIDEDDDEISLNYSLGPLLILDVFEVKNKAQLVYLKNHLKNLTLDLVIEYDDATDNDANFTYYLKGNKLNRKSTGPIEGKELIPYADKISGFIWLVKDGKEINSLNKEEGTNYKPSAGLKKL